LAGIAEALALPDESLDPVENPAWWIDAIHATSPIPAIVAETWRRSYDTYSNPAVLTCSDGADYVVKALRTGRESGLRYSRPLITDQVAGRLGSRMGAPVAPVTLVEVPAEMIANQPQLARWRSGVAHGSRWIETPTNAALTISYTAEAANAERYADLAVLYGWFHAGDRQFLYTVATPHLVFSADHGHFLPGAPGWTSDTLLRGQADVNVDPVLVGAVGLSLEVLSRSVQKLTGITNADVAEAVAAPPANWGITMPDRIALGQFLARRRDQMIRDFSRVAR
jgi:hypothetical protein